MRIASVTAAIVLALAGEAAAQKAPQDVAAGIVAGDIDAASVDVGEWRDERPEDLRALIAALDEMAPTGSANFSYEIFDLRRLANWALSVPDAAAYEASRARVDAYVETLRDEVERLDELAADETHPRHGQWTRYVAAAQAETDPVTKELLRRAAREQFLRLNTGGVDPALTTADLPHVRQPVSNLWLNEDISNTQWLKGVVAERGWFTIGRDGADASSAAWLMVLHASFDREWQREMLAVMEPLARQREIDPHDFATLFDGLALTSGQPTRYGTQGLGCTADGQSYNFGPIEEPEMLDIRRAELGLPPFAEASAGADQRCREAAGG